MSRRKRSANSVSLFPFLAVLMCAMGALIVLLILTTSRIRSQAVARAGQRQQEALPAVEPQSVEPAPGPELRPPAPVPFDPDAELRERIARLAERHEAEQFQRDAQDEQLAAARRSVDEAEAALSASREKLEDAGSEQQRRSEAVAALEQQAGTLPAQYEATVRQLRKLQQQQQNAASRYSVIAYDGSAGTTRRPILIECTGQGLRFLPEDIALTENDLAGFTEGFNPLLAGASTLVKYWDTRNRLVPEAEREPEPYVLLLVRPSGTMAYYAARKLLSRLDQPFGYELLDDGQQIAVPELDPQAKSLCAAAVQEVLAQRDEVREAVVANDPPGGRELRFRRGGGFDVIESDESEGGWGREGAREEGRPMPGRSPWPRGTGDAGGPGGESSITGEPFVSGDGTIPGALAAGEAGSATMAATARHPHSPAGRAGGGLAAQQGIATSDNPRSPAARAAGDEEFNGRSETPSVGSAARSQDESSTDPRQSGTASIAAAMRPDGAPEEVFPTFGQPPSGLGSASRAGQHSSTRRWGQADLHATIGFERDLTIRAEPSRLIVGDGTVVPAGKGELPDELARQVAEAIDQEARLWGRPPEHFYWVPKLRFLVAPGGNQHCERVRGRLRRYGLASTVEYRFDTPEAPASIPSLEAGGGRAAVRPQPARGAAR